MTALTANHAEMTTRLERFAGELPGAIAISPGRWNAFRAKPRKILAGLSTARVPRPSTLPRIDVHDDLTVENRS